MKWTIRYYLTENAFRTKTPSFKETVNGDKNFATKWAQNKLKNSQFKYFDLVEN